MKKIVALIGLIGIVWILFQTNIFAYNSEELNSANNLAKKLIIKNHFDKPEQYNLDSPVLRQEIALISRRVSWVKESNSCKNLFDDVSAFKPNDWACKNIEALVENELISANASFNPENNISKSEALIMFVKSIWFIDFVIDSSSSKNWQEQVVDFAVKNEIAERFSDYNAEAKRWWIFKIADYSIKVKETRVKAGLWRDKYSDEVKIEDEGNWNNEEPTVGTPEFLEKYPMCTDSFRDEIKNSREFNSKIDLKAASQEVYHSTIWYEPCSSEEQSCFDEVKGDYLGDGKYSPCYIWSSCYEEFKTKLIKCANESMNCKEKAFCGFVTE